MVSGYTYMYENSVLQRRAPVAALHPNIDFPILMLKVQSKHHVVKRRLVMADESEDLNSGDEQTRTLRSSVKKRKPLPGMHRASRTFTTISTYIYSFY